MQPLRIAGALCGALVALLVGCATSPGAKQPLAVAEIPAGDYDVSTVVALAPTRQADGEFVAAVVYLLRPSTRLQIWEGSYPAGSRGWLVVQPRGQGSGQEHLKLVKSTGNYNALRLDAGEGKPVGYALVHKAVGPATFSDSGGKVTLFLQASNFIDPHYIDGMRR